MQKGAIVGEQQKARCLLVETPDGGKRRVAALPAIGQERIDAFPCFLMRTGHAERLVHHHHAAGQGVQLFAFVREARGQIGLKRNALVDARNACAIEQKASRLREHGNLAARAIAQIGEQLVEPDIRHFAHASAS